jgi:16S rRNA (adenine1518-N6/adenine1519-N6)-dimethyltransferase
MDMLPEPRIKLDNYDDFLEIVRGGFSSPRKQIHNSLAQGLRMEPGDVKSLLERAAINPQYRAEKLSLDDWERLYKSFISVRKV